MKVRAARPVPAVVAARIAAGGAFHFGPEPDETRRAYADAARRIEERDWLGLLSLGARGNRWGTFRAVKPFLADDEYWPSLRYVYEDTETLWQQRDVARLFGARRTGRELMMTRDERAELAALPAVVSVLRGCQPINRDGWSWTLSEERAGFFARRWGTAGLVRRGRIERAHVIAFLKGREEAEIICNPALVRVSHEEPVAASVAAMAP